MQPSRDAPLGKLFRPSAAILASLLHTASPELASQVTSPSGQHSATKFGLGRPTCSKSASDRGPIRVLSLSDTSPMMQRPHEVS